VEREIKSLVFVLSPCSTPMCGCSSREPVTQWIAALVGKGALQSWEIKPDASVNSEKLSLVTLGLLSSNFPRSHQDLRGCISPPPSNGWYGLAHTHSGRSPFFSKWRRFARHGTSHCLQRNKPTDYYEESVPMFVIWRTPTLTQNLFIFTTRVKRAHALICYIKNLRRDSHLN
jgi:hypothetical protein